mmetsp:Transcript_80310/g.134397  ORF Transcript_80310/g.134397 Transcript_80310/m.134397 type:complete len:113 (+) Transcript_80310:32-370(+)
MQTCLSDALSTNGGQQNGKKFLFSCVYTQRLHFFSLERHLNPMFQADMGACALMRHGWPDRVDLFLCASVTSNPVEPVFSPASEIQPGGKCSAYEERKKYVSPFAVAPFQQH